VSRSRQLSRMEANSSDGVIGSLTSALVNTDSVVLLADLMSRLKSFEQRKFLSAVIAFVAKHYCPSDISRHGEAPIIDSAVVSGVAGLVYGLVQSSEGLKDLVVSILTQPTIPSLDDSLAARRSVMAALAQDEGQIIRPNMKIEY
jgi:telomere length regulation protein